MKQAPRTPEQAVERVKKLQKNLLKLLYLAMALHVLGKFFPTLGFISGALLVVYFLIEMFLLPPVGMAIMCLVVSVVFLFLFAVVQILVALLIESIALVVVGAVVAFAFSGVLVTVSYGVIMSIEIISVEAPVLIATGIFAGVSGLTAATGVGVTKAVESAGRTAGKARRKAVLSVIGSFLVFVVLGWPCLSYAQGINGAIACKPAVILNQAHVNAFNVGTGTHKEYKKLFEDEKRWVFPNKFYNNYINNGRSNISQGSDSRVAGGATYLAVLQDNLLYVQSPEVDGLYYSGTYMPRKTDAMVVAKGYTFIFGRNKVYIAGEDGFYTWRKTRWTSRFEKLSAQEQFDQIYDILERQNTDEAMRFSFEEVAVVAYAQRNGLLLNYNGDSHTAWFTQTDKNGTVTVYAQTGPGRREEKTAFTPTYSDYGLPYIMLDDGTLIYLRDNCAMVLDGGKDWAEYEHFTNPDGDLVALSDMDLGYEGEYIIYLTETGMLCVDTSGIGVNSISRTEVETPDVQVMGTAGNYVYSIRYEDSFLSWLTYINDVDLETTHAGWGVADIWMAGWDFQRLTIDRSNYDPEYAAEQEAEAAREKLYTAPIVADSPDKLADYDRRHISAMGYNEYTGPQEGFAFQYPERIYDNVEYTVENEGADIDILFTRSDDETSRLIASVHPLPGDVEDLEAYAKSLFNETAGEMDVFQSDAVEEYGEGVYRFRLEGWTDISLAVKRWVICQVDGENVMWLELQIPWSTDDEDKLVRNFYAERLNYLCGFGIPSKAPTLG